VEWRGIDKGALVQCQPLDQCIGKGSSAQNDGGATPQKEQDRHHEVVTHGQHPEYRIPGGYAQAPVSGVGSINNGLVGEQNPLAGAGGSGTETDKGGIGFEVPGRRTLPGRSSDKDEFPGHKAVTAQLFLTDILAQPLFCNNEIHINPIDDRIDLPWRLLRGNWHDYGRQGKNGQTCDHIIDAVITQQTDALQLVNISPGVCSGEIGTITADRERMARLAIT